MSEWALLAKAVTGHSVTDVPDALVSSMSLELLVEAFVSCVCDQETKDKEAARLLEYFHHTFQNDRKVCLEWFSDFLLSEVWDVVFNRIFFLRDYQSLSRVVLPAGKTSVLMNHLDLLLLNCQIPLDDRAINNSWDRVFSSADDGHGWTLFYAGLLKHPGSTIIVLRDKQGNVFGGYNSCEWKNRPTFFGDSKSFIFSLYPRQRVYHASGINHNFQYLNSGSRTLTSGIGMGGQVDFFGWYISQDFENGHTRGLPTSTTFGNPPLSGDDEDFLLDQVEVWLVKPSPVEDEVFDEGKKSVLDNAAASNFLEMSGHKMYSKDLPEKDV
ncbi:MAG: hypothetical protein SGCHY_003249 [Lobulomycetales sp.]